MNEIVIHAGISKTGSTSIQNSLFNNEDFLKKHHFEYLDITNIRKIRFVNHSGPIMSMFGDKPEHHHVNIINDWDPNQANKHYRQQLTELKNDRGKIAL